MSDDLNNQKKNLNILFVDNSKTTRFAMQRLLEEQGYSVEACASGQEAIELVSQELFDLLVIDLFMPDMNGHEAARKIRELPNKKVSKMPIIAFSSSNSEKDAATAKNAGIDVFVSKTERNLELLEEIEKFR